MYNLTARDIFWATEGKRVPDQKLYADVDGLSVASQLATNIKLDMLEHTWMTGKIPHDLELQPLYEEFGEHLPEVVKQLWIDGFDVSFKVELRKCSRTFLFFTIPSTYKVWLMTVAAVSRTPRNESNYIPITIPSSVSF